jgi:hypothetical protein
MHVVHGTGVRHVPGWPHSDLKDDLSLRPIFHQLEHRIEAHIFVAFIAYCLHVTLRARLRPACPRADPTGCVGQICYYPDARRALPDHGRSHFDFKPLHPSRT